MNNKMRFETPMSLNLTIESDPDRKVEIVKMILADLPEWFGIEQAVHFYIEDAKSSQCFVVTDHELPVAFCYRFKL
ncbi:hypothetical protein [Facklamia miroungae]|uniref:Uncharacterized protein n=1 Tax=Facklamia miroungae TaxID=120956 RepID=A0A1G7RU82_9LACT|nr:hypothetical protein [Facklamia miroungae]SDG14387.1 hypothetical protein SAMN05421791_103183 [Facklamia miroungae]